MAFLIPGRKSNPAPKNKRELATCHTEPIHIQLQEKQVYLHWQVKLPKVPAYATSYLVYSPDAAR